MIHNASFDLGFLNAELERIGRPALLPARAIDTVALARRKYPAAPASLDALCRRFEIDNSKRDLHGALLDAQLLAGVYFELIGGRQPNLALQASQMRAKDEEGEMRRRGAYPRRHHAPTSGESAAHIAFLATLDDPIWEN